MSIEEARKRIKEAKVTGSKLLDLRFLSLSNREFIELLPKIKELTNLTGLDLSRNNLSNCDFLKDLPNLTELYLGFNNLQNYDFLIGLTNLTTLDLSKNNLSDGNFLSRLQNLIWLDLSNNNLSKGGFLSELNNLTTLYLRNNYFSDGDFLSRLNNLTTFDLSNNNLRNYNFLTKLNSLTTLNLRNNNLSDGDFLTGLQNLIWLDLSNNNFKNYDFLTGLNNLTTLYLRNNSLSNFDSLSKLKNLKELDLKDNRIWKADFLSEFKNLTWLDLRNNYISNCDFLKNLPNLTELYLKTNRDLPDFGVDLDSQLNREEIEKIIKFYEDLKVQGKDYIYEAKILIIGQPRAGKTTLRRKMLNPDYDLAKSTDEEKKSTLAIEIETFSFPVKTTNGEEKEFNSYLWDFGGQDIQYVLHQYFLTERSLYVFLYDVGSEDEKTNYWFEIIAALGKDSPVLVVLNYKEIPKSRPSNFSIDTYRKAFADKIKDISERKVDFAVNDGDWENLYQTIKNKVSTLEHIGRDFLPKKTVEVRNWLNDLDKPIISLDEYYELCREKQIEEEEAEIILTRLHEFGVALWYQNDDSLRNKVILKPNWVIDALYVVLKEDSIQKNNGKFYSETVYQLWKNYREEDKSFLLGLMQKGVFSTAYKLQNEENWYIVPALLTEDSPKYQFTEQNLIQIYYEYNFMPEGIISRLIVELNEKIHSRNGGQIVWKKGVLLESKDSLAEVVQSIRDRRITIKVSGTEKYRNKELLSDIRKEIEKIHRQIFKNRLTVSEFVPCPCEVCKTRKINFEKLTVDEIRSLTEERKTEYETDSFTLNDLIERLYKLRKSTIECRKSANDVNVQELLGEIYLDSKIRKEIEDLRENEFLLNKAADAQMPIFSQPNLIEQRQDFPQILKKDTLTDAEIALMTKGKELETTSKNIVQVLEILAGLGIIALSYYKTDEVIREWGKLEPLSFLYTVPYILGLGFIFFGLLRRHISLEIIDNWLVNITQSIIFYLKDEPLRKYKEVCQKFEENQKRN